MGKQTFRSNGVSKICTDCLLDLPIDRFHKARSKDGLRHNCKTCRSNRARETNVPYMSLSQEKKRHILETNRTSRLNNAESHLLKNAKRRAKMKNLAFSIDRSDIVIPEYCPILGLKLEFSRNLAGCSSPSLDRIDSTKGYVKGNVQVISWRANRIKTDATLEELTLLLTYLKTL